MIRRSLQSDSPAARRRLESVDDLAALIRPTARRPGSVDGALLIVPSLRRPRLLVPRDARRAAANAVLRHGVPTTTKARLQRYGISFALRAGLGVRLFPAVASHPTAGPTLLDHLEEVFGIPLVASVALTPPRANRKPVLHLLRPDGRTLAFVKVAVNELTQTLVQHEANTLAAIGARATTSFIAPGVLYRGSWHGFDYVVLSALDTSRGRTPDPALLNASMRELATMFPTEVSLAQYADGLAQRARRIAVRTEQSHELAEFVERLAERASDAHLELGTWHGDWTPWNCGQVADRLLIWDWERCRVGVPPGFDALHYDMQRDLHRAVDLASAARNCLRRAPITLSPWRLRPDVVPLIAQLYLAELGVRYLQDDQHRAGGRGGDVGGWIIPALREHTSDRPSRGISL